jgi:hypothetical protein
MEAIVAHAVAIAIAGLLVEHGWNLRRQLIGVRLVGILRVRSPELVLGKDGREFGPLGRRTGIVSRNASFFFRSGPLSRHGQRHG